MPEPTYELRSPDRGDLYTRLAGCVPEFDETRMSESITASPETVDEDRGALEAGMTGLLIA